MFIKWDSLCRYGLGDYTSGAITTNAFETPPWVMKKFSGSLFKNAINSAIIHYAVGNRKKANTLAIAIDTTALGPLQLLTTMTGLGGIITFDISAMPNLSERFREAGVEVGREKIGAISFPAIIQKELE